MTERQTHCQCLASLGRGCYMDIAAEKSNVGDSGREIGTAQGRLPSRQGKPLRPQHQGRHSAGSPRPVQRHATDGAGADGNISAPALRGNNPAANKIAVADELGDKAGGWICVELRPAAPPPGRVSRKGW
jgi:hypothetical protein